MKTLVKKNKMLVENKCFLGFTSFEEKIIILTFCFISNLNGQENCGRSGMQQKYSNFKDLLTEIQIRFDL